ncbi:MAG: hypothetical protein JSS58_00055 [Proteobacteria bacterium]|nr:hypothetical protein [Pseudomonadota bacterium]
MKRTTLLIVALACCGAAHAQSPGAAQPGGASTEPSPAVIDYVQKTLGQVFLNSVIARQKADYAAIAAHCARLDSVFSARYAARRPELERQWLAKQQQMGMFIEMAGAFMQSRQGGGGDVSIGDLVSKMSRAMRTPEANTSGSASNAPGRIDKRATPPIMPEAPVATQEIANGKAMEEVRSRMQGLSREQQQELCEGGLVSGAIPVQPGKDAADGKEAPQGM